MRIKIEIEGDQVSVKTDDAKRIDEDQEAEKIWFRDAIAAEVKRNLDIRNYEDQEAEKSSFRDAIGAESKRNLGINIDEDQEAEKAWFRDAIGHQWIVMKTDRTTLSGKGWFAYTDETAAVHFIEDPNGWYCKAYYKLPPLPLPESNK